jgi:hypothetical protein
MGFWNFINKATTAIAKVAVVSIGIAIGVYAAQAAMVTVAGLKIAAAAGCLMTVEGGKVAIGAAITGSLAYISTQTVLFGVQIKEESKGCSE